MARRPITSPWTPEQDEKLKTLASQKATMVRVSAALNKPISSVRIRARKLGLVFPGVRELKKKMRLLAEQEAQLSNTR